MKIKLKNFSKKILIIIISVTIINYFNNAFTYILLILSFILNDKFNNKNKIEHQQKLIFFVIIYNIFNLYIIFKNKYLLFWDNQYLFKKLNCNINISNYYLKLDLTSYECPKSLGFGILQDIIKISIDPWVASIILYFVLIFFLILIYKNSGTERKIIMSYFLISPAFLSLINSLNSDIFVLIFCFYLILNKKLTLNIFDFMLISFLIQLKIYPIALLLGFLIFSILNSNLKNILLTTTFFLFNTLLLIKYLTSNPSEVFYKTFFGVPVVYAPISSFGFLGDIFTFFDVPLTKEIGNFNLIKIFLILFILVVILIKQKIITNFKKHFSILIQNQLFIFIHLIFLINLFGNNGYKFVFNILIVYLCFEYLNNYEKIFMLIFIFLIPINYILGNNSYPLLPMFAANIYSTSIWFISRFIFYIFNFYLFVNYFIMLKIKIFKKLNL